MKGANTKEMQKYAKEICRNADLIEELGLMYNMQVHTLCNFFEELQQAYEDAKDQDKFLEMLRETVKDEVIKILANSKRVSTIKLVKYYYIFTEAELNSLFSKHTTVVDNIKRLIIISEVEKLLVNTVPTTDEDQLVAKAVNRIYKALL